MILKYVCPDYRVKSIFDISPKWLKRNGYMKIVVDIDNTLLPRDKNLVGPRAMTWIRQMHQLGINVALISITVATVLKQLLVKPIWVLLCVQQSPCPWLTSKLLRLWVAVKFSSLATS